MNWGFPWNQAQWPMPVANYTTGTGRKYYKKKSKRSKSYKKVPKAFKKNLLALKESKFVDDSNTEAPVAATSSIQFITGIAQGDADNTRDGDTIYVTSFQCKGIVVGDVDQTKDVFMRIMLVKKVDCRGATVTFTNMYNTDNINSMREVDNSKNFQVLKSKMVTVRVPDQETVDVRRQVKYDWFYKFKTPLRVKYLATDSAITAADRNHLFLICVTDGTATTAPTYVNSSRLTFKDV